MTEICNRDSPSTLWIERNKSVLELLDGVKLRERGEDAVEERVEVEFAGALGVCLLDEFFNFALEGGVAAHSEGVAEVFGRDEFCVGVFEAGARVEFELLEEVGTLDIGKVLTVAGHLFDFSG